MTAVSILLALGACTAVVPLDEEPKLAQGSAVTSVWDGVYSEAQAERGEATYRKACARCHRDDLKGEELAPSLVGATFTFRWRDQGVSDLFASLRSSMPPESPGSLSDQTYVDVVAFLLSANHYPAGDNELEPDVEALAEIAIERARP